MSMWDLGIMAIISLLLRIHSVCCVWCWEEFQAFKQPSEIVKVPIILGINNSATLLSVSRYYYIRIRCPNVRRSLPLSSSGTLIARSP